MLEFLFALIIWGGSKSYCDDGTLVTEDYFSVISEPVTIITREDESEGLCAPRE